jgi:hypothetical protein
VKDGGFDFGPGGRARVDQIEVIGFGDFHDGDTLVDFLFSLEIAAAEIWRNINVGLTQYHDLRCLDRQAHGVGFAVVVGDFVGAAAEKLLHGVVAKVQVVGPLQVEDTSE